MPTTHRRPNHGHDQDHTSNWITLASMFVGQRLDKRAAVGAYVAVAITLAVSVVILLAIHP